jgi:hypothetical protein
MKAKDVLYVKDTVDNEGFDYAFTHYTDFEEIGDAEFHRLRKAYVAARAALAEYCGLENV